MEKLNGNVELLAGVAQRRLYRRRFYSTVDLVQARV